MTDETKIKIGQMFMLGIPGEQFSDELAVICKKYSIGNFCISAENALSLEKLCKMTSVARKLTYESTGIYPFLATDQEGGWVTRFYEGAALIPGAMSYSASGANGEKMERVGKKLGSILRAVGCNMNNAPVLDTNINSNNPIIGTRSYGDDAQRVAQLGTGFSRGLQSEKVITAVKHFPGHGNVNSDTHLGAAHNSSDADTLRKTELLPFKKAFESGAGAIMTAHVIYDSLCDCPATVSREIMTDLLREELGFDGVAISDSMNMKAVSRAYPNGAGAVMAIEAGCDILLYYPFEPSLFKQAIDAVYEAVESGRISEKRINESFERIMRQKESFEIADAEPDVELAKRLVYNEADIAEIFEDKLSSITCLKDDGVLKSLADKRILCLAPVCDALRGVEEARRKILSFADIFADNVDGADGYITSLEGLTAEIEEKIDGEYDVAVVGIFDAANNRGQLDLIKAIQRNGRPIVAVLLRSPYDYGYVKECNAVVTCYEYTTLAVNATVEAMKRGEYRGNLPVNIPQ